MSFASLTSVVLPDGRSLLASAGGLDGAAVLPHEAIDVAARPVIRQRG
jgi:hypothetical protein